MMVSSALTDCISVALTAATFSVCVEELFSFRFFGAVSAVGFSFFLQSEGLFSNWVFNHMHYIINMIMSYVAKVIYISISKMLFSTKNISLYLEMH